MTRETELIEIPEGVEPQPCEHCHADVYLVENPDDPEEVLAVEVDPTNVAHDIPTPMLSGRGIGHSCEEE